MDCRAVMPGEAATNTPASPPHRSPNRAGAALRLLRPHQWVKNVLVLLPLLLSHQVGDVEKLIAALLAMALFCLAASSVYVINDAFDVEADRHHPRKRHRPFAAGDLPLSWTWPITVALLVAAVVPAAVFLPRGFLLMLVGYVLISGGYSFWLKSRLLVDVIVLAGLYTWRVLAGGAATGIAVSPWLLALCTFLFLSLAFAKRYVELRQLSAAGDRHARSRGYGVDDLAVIEVVGPCCGILAGLVLALYLNSETVARLYARPTLVWAACPIMIYWITRVWFFARRGALNDDPVTFALTDRVSWLVLAAIAATFLLAWLDPLRLVG